MPRIFTWSKNMREEVGQSFYDLEAGTRGGKTQATDVRVERKGAWALRTCVSPIPVLERQPLFCLIREENKFLFG